MKLRKLFILFFLSLFFLPLVQALAVNGAKLSPIIFEPGKIITNHYRVEDATSPLEVAVSGDFSEDISVSEVVNNEFDLIINFSETYPPAGSYRFILSVRELPEGSAGGIGTLLSVTKMFFVEVYSHEKEVEVGLSAANINVGDDVPLRVNVKSRTYSDIDAVSAVIYLTDDNNKTLGTTSTDAKKLYSLAELSLEAKFSTRGLEAGEYKAQAIVHFDGKEKKTEETSFKIGIRKIILQNYTSLLRQGFSEYSLRVLNAWGNELQNVYAKILLNGSEILQTATTTLQPWEEKELQGIVNIAFPPGNYSGKIELYFEDEMMEENITLTIEPLPGKLSEGKIAYGIIIAIIIAILFLCYWRYKQRNADEGW